MNIHSNRRQAGRKAESRALSYLVNKGYKCLDRNVFLGRHGELDLVMQARDGAIVFIEVRSHSNRILADSQILPKLKQLRLVSLCRRWLVQNHLDERRTNWRLDLIVVSTSPSNSKSRYLRSKDTENINWFQAILWNLFRMPGGSISISDHRYRSLLCRSNCGNNCIILFV